MGIEFGLDVGVDANLKFSVAKENKAKIPRKALLDNFRIASFVIPVVPVLGIALPGSLRLTFNSELEMTMLLEKQIDINISYSKHLKFALPFQYRSEKLGYPALSRLTNVYGSTNYNGDFQQLKQVPKFDVLSSLSAVLTVKWPDFSGNKINSYK